MKRFTETCKWEDPWFRQLSPNAKLLWGYICDRCDIAGVWEPDQGLASYLIGSPIDLNSCLKEFDSRIKVLPSGKWLLTKFVKFQWGTLNDANACHRGVLDRLKHHDLEGALEDHNSSFKGAKEKEKEKEKDGKGHTRVKVAPYHEHSVEVLNYLNLKTGRNFRKTETSLRPISARLSEDGVDLPGVFKMIDRQTAKWKGTNMEDYLRPETLFGKQKFDGYYASKDQEVILNNTPVVSKSITPTQMTLHNQELIRVMEAIKEVKGQASQDAFGTKIYSEEDRKKLNSLVLRRNDLRAILGVTV